MIRSRQESSDNLLADTMDRLLSLTTNHQNDDDTVIHTLVSTNDVNLHIMEFLDITSFARYGMLCRGTRRSMGQAMERRSKQLQALALHMDHLLNGDGARHPDTVAYFPSDEALDQFYQALDDLQALVSGCALCRDCSKNRKFPLFEKERHCLFQEIVTDALMILPDFAHCRLSRVCQDDATVLERDVTAEHESTCNLIKYLDLNYMKVFRTQEFRDNMNDVDDDEAYLDLAHENGTFMDFNIAATKLITVERFPAFRIAAWREAQEDPSLHCAFVMVLRMAMFQALDLISAQEEEESDSELITSDEEA